MSARRVLAGLFLFGIVFCASTTWAQDVTETITFDDLAAGTVVTTQYTAQGFSALFSDAVIIPDVALAGNHFLAAAPLGTEFNPGDLTIAFISPQHTVSFNGGFAGTGVDQGTLQAFDKAGNPVAPPDGPRMITGSGVSTAFSVTTSMNADLIDHVEFTVASITHDPMIDNLQIVGEPPPPPTGAQPQVVITTPASGITDITSVVLSGTVTGTNIVQNATFTVEFQAPPPGPTVVKTEFSLTPTSDPTKFTFLVSKAIPPGTVTLTIEAQNIFGVKGSADVVLTNLPSSVLAQCTSTGALGAFQYGVTEPKCIVNICAQGAVSSHDASGVSHVMPAAISSKWVTVGDQRIPGNLGCPISDAAPPPDFPSATRQDFERGRIYEVGTNVFYVPKVFSDAMTNLGDEKGIGVPTTDPVVNTFVLDVNTSWYQHYQRSVSPGDLGTTMEIRGASPVLSVERQGGDLNDLLAAATFSGGTAALWDRFSCTGNGPWTCPTTPPQPHVTPNPAFGALLHQFCSGGNPAVCPDINPVVFPVVQVCLDSWPVANWTNALASGLEWGALPLFQAGNDYAYRDLKGWIRTGGNHLATFDAPTTHQYTNDYNINVLPFAAYDGLLAGNDPENIEIEIEWYYFRSFWFSNSVPLAGDLIYLNGRWITDCGHDPNPTEIHPPGIIGDTRTAQLYGTAVTYAFLTANGFFRGVPTTFRIEPPPRPSPDAELFLVEPSDTGTIVGGIAVNADLFFDHVDVNLSRNPQVTAGTVNSSGEMFWPGGVGSYSGKFYVGWL
jgi:hypothetical protein